MSLLSKRLLKGYVFSAKWFYLAAVTLIIIRFSSGLYSKYQIPSRSLQENKPSAMQNVKVPVMVQYSEISRLQSRKKQPIKSHDDTNLFNFPSGKSNNNQPDTVSLRAQRKENQNGMVTCRQNQATSTGGFCLSEDNIFTGYNHAWDGMFCKGLEFVFGENATVGDFGAGLGHYGRCFYRRWNNVVHTNSHVEILTLINNFEVEMKIANLTNKPQVIKSWKGYDGALNLEALSEGFIKYLDLSKHQDLGERFDWVMSVEVGEHIPAQYESIFLQNLVTHACKGLVLTWSSEKENHYHVNPRQNDYIIQRVEELGLRHDPDTQKFLRDSIRMPYLKPSLMVFRVGHPQC